MRYDIIGDIHGHSQSLLALWSGSDTKMTAVFIATLLAPRFFWATSLTAGHFSEQRSVSFGP